jgi:glutamate dehydrogenase
MVAASPDPHSLITVELYQEPGCRNTDARIKIVSRTSHSLSVLLPPFTAFGLEVVDERTDTECDGTTGKDVYVIDLGLRGLKAAQDPFCDRDSRRFVEAVEAVWSARCESDRLNSLILQAQLTWRQVTWLRAVAAYLRQIEVATSMPYICDVIARHPTLAALAVSVFEERFDPGRHGGDVTPQRREAESRLASLFIEQLNAVPSLTEERILRSLLAIIQATVRTNAFQLQARSQCRLSLKIEPALLPAPPQPVPTAEIWVYGPRVEGVHLRFGKVARGGIRWSDRREDFRTEALALTKAQVAKNAVIVPTGAKGTFLPKQLPNADNRDAWLREGEGSYREFIAALLDVTDNRIGDEVRRPHNVVSYDGDDPYLVVAADKGTATFSDVANRVSHEYEFWLSDAFASGGSQGYDHKTMGITARGAWVSVERHLREEGIDPRKDDFTVVGIGDMSGDVFGNGMLMSEHIRLIAAFDHRHVFLDPNPDVALALAERRRLASLSQSSWLDYDASLISAGGGVIKRSDKSVRISPEVAAALGVVDHLQVRTPSDLIKAILCSPVDLLWNGGIGTYVKASHETQAQVGDRANDPVRVDADALRAKAIAEGGNLGLTQAGRVEAARAGVRVNTDAIDNSAGVDTSDHEVNIKIALRSAKNRGVAEKDHAALLGSMTAAVAESTLNHNYEQNVLLAMESHHAAANFPLHRLLIRRLTDSGHLDRMGHVMPTEAQLDAREPTGEGLCGPEIAILMASSKIALKEALTATALTDDRWFKSTLRDYFPPQLRETFSDEIENHPLGGEIVVNTVVNDVVNRAGIAAVYRAADETGAPLHLVIKAYVAAIECFGHRTLSSKLRDAEDNGCPLTVLATIRHEGRRLLDRAARWFLSRHPSDINISEVVARLQPRISTMSPSQPDRLCGEERDRFESNFSNYQALGASDELARIAATYLDSYVLLDIVEMADELNQDSRHVAALYHLLSNNFRVDYLLTRVSLLPRKDRWDRLARTALREDLYSALASLTRAVAARAGGGLTDPQEEFERWQRDTTHLTARAQIIIDQVCTDERPPMGAISVAVRTLRALTQVAQHEHPHLQISDVVR